MPRLHLCFFFVTISSLGLLVGRIEGWSRLESWYYAFITATTVGYGDFRPTKKISRLFAVLIAFLGLIFTGILVALAVKAVAVTIKSSHQLDSIKESVEHIAQ